MGKYMRTRRKSKTSTATEVSLMELPSLNGVLTRAKSLALQNVVVSSSGSYIQLRSRRLVKPSLVKKQKDRAVKSVDLDGSFVKQQEIFKQSEGIGENMVETEARGRITRETTLCSLIGDPDAIKIPGSSTKATTPSETKYRVQDSEMEEFFTGPEKQQQRLFIEKYNFDPVNDKPLPGRYEWVKLDATKKS